MIKLFVFELDPERVEFDRFSFSAEVGLSLPLPNSPGKKPFFAERRSIEVNDSESQAESNHVSTQDRLAENKQTLRNK